MLDPADVETERGVILEEIAMHDDEPGDEVHDLFAEAIYGDHPLGRLISGTRGDHLAADPPADPRLLPRRYRAAAIVVAAAGNLDHAAVVRQVRAALRGTPLDASMPGAAPTRRVRRRRRRGCAPARVAVLRQGHRAGARRARRRRARPRDDERRFALGVLNNVARRRHVEPAVPGDPRAARAGVLGLLVRLAVRRRRPVRGVRRLRARQGRGGARPDPRRAGRRSPPTASPTPRWPAARAWPRGRTCSGWRTPARG